MVLMLVCSVVCVFLFSVCCSLIIVWLVLCIDNV